MKKLRVKTVSKYFLYALLCVCFLTSCGKNKIYKYEVNKACEVCKDHDGLLYMHYDVWEWVIKCNDGYVERVK